MEYKPVIGVGAKPEEERSNSKDVVLQGMPNYVKQLIAGGVAGGLSKTAVAPLERVKILYQVGSVSLSHPFLQLLIVGYFVQNHVVQIVLLAKTPSRSAFLSFLPLYSTVTVVHAQYSFPPQTPFVFASSMEQSILDPYSLTLSRCQRENPNCLHADTRFAGLFQCFCTWEGF
jgi:hypothetical protein